MYTRAAAASNHSRFENLVYARCWLAEFVESRRICNCCCKAKSQIPPFTRLIIVYAVQHWRKARFSHDISKTERRYTPSVARHQQESARELDKTRKAHFESQITGMNSLERHKPHGMFENSAPFKRLDEREKKLNVKYVAPNRSTRQ